MENLAYDACAGFLARLEDPENLDADINTTTANIKNSNRINNSLGGSPISVLDTSLSLSPIDNRNSASPPGLSTGSVTSHSPESLRFDYEVPWNPNEAAFFSPIEEGILQTQAWDLMSAQGQPRDQHQVLNDYIKIENGNSPGPYFGPSQQATISPTQSLLDPASQTALEETYPYAKEGDSLFDFNSYGTGAIGPVQGNNPDSYTMAWGNRAQQEEGFAPISWQSPAQPQQLPQQRQQRQLPAPHPQETPPSMLHTVSPSPPHRAASSLGSHDDDNDALPRSKKRKTCTDDVPIRSPPAPVVTHTTRKQQPKKTAHNMIEKRYRTNLNDKIAALRDSVPSLRVMAGTSKLGEDDDEEDLEGLTPAHKLNKATVLAKATEYIRHLEKRSKRLQDENDRLKVRLAAFEKFTLGPLSGQGGNGSKNGGGPGSGMVGRIMVGGLASLMVVDGLQEQESGNRQLSVLPMSIMQLFGSQGSSAASGNQLFWLAFRMALLVAAVVYIVIPSFFDSGKDKSKASGTLDTANLSPVPSLASSLEVRRQAWLTAIQSVWVPRRSIILEVAALGFKTLKLSIRKLIGWHGYALITGTSEEHEVARVKAWTIALDAQLAGGDAIVNYSRLLLTLLASLTLPATPSRLMLNALHVRVLLWDLGNGFEVLAKRLASHCWHEARRQQRSLIGLDSTENLPDHLARLLDLDPNVVLHGKIVQKAYNLAYNRGAQDGFKAYDEGMDTVVEDQSIRSPLDAAAAWYSSLVLQRVFASSLRAGGSETLKKQINQDLHTALEVAPPNSKAQLRALVTRAMLENHDDGKQLRMAMKALEEDAQSRDPSIGMPRALESRPSPAATPDIKIAVRCAMALNLLRNGSRDGAIRLFSELDWQEKDSGDIRNKLGLLGFVAIWKTLNHFIANDDRWVSDAGESVDKAAGMLRVWIGGKNMPKKAGVQKEDCKRVIDFCNSLQKKLAGLSDDMDDGYASGCVDERKPITV